ncbi:YcnI family protein [Amycolatopsis sp. K13G38]|uniref:YcnI family protein n=1 Tax=Amycolatopsis acididurans TaxID=2724524 RepID=A0ABX1JDX8_9PSEU|nr:YcnI family protein [Amycolatopsis acididurans]NKQ57446.1 YcnI family protein [Amycolatopsis acididurans]
MATLAVPPAAFAHISITPGTVETGAPAVFSFHVPNENDTASTVRLEVVFPTDQPLSAATPQAVPGWRITVRKLPLDKPMQTSTGMSGQQVQSIVWEGGQIPPDTYAEFPVRVNAMPDKPGALAFKTLQTYSDGTVSRWIDATEPGKPEPEHPAPTVTVSAAVPAAAEESTSDTTAIALGGAGLGAGVIALAVALWARLTPRREKGLR